MIYLGSHLSISKGFYEMGKTALSIGADTFQFFTRNPQGGARAKKIDLDDVKKLRILMDENNFGPLVAHAPYTLNACSSTKRTREFAKMIMKDDIERMEFLPGNFYNFHPGSHTGQGVETGIELISSMLNEILTEDQHTIVLLETMAGKGSEVGKKFSELKSIIDRVNLSEKVGVCLDTCHVHDAGYNVVESLDKTLDEFDAVIGLDRLHAVHVNDSMNERGSHKDRHQKIGQGYIGTDAIVRILNHHKLQNLPFILETPNDLEGYAAEIKLLRGKIQQK